MCGIIAGVSDDDIAPLLLNGLEHLQYRGYDSAGIAVVDAHHKLRRIRVLGQVQKLIDCAKDESLFGHTGIAHTRWATHGKPSIRNAHPHIVHNDIAVVHNGIIENFESLRIYLLEKGCSLKSETDSELIAHLVYLNMQSGHDFLTAVRETVTKLEGTFSLCFLRRREPQRLIGCVNGSPLIVGLGKNANFIVSDKMALSSVANEFIVLNDGDIVDLYSNQVKIIDFTGASLKRPVIQLNINSEIATKNNYPHFMLKEIFEQTDIISALIEKYGNNPNFSDIFGSNVASVFSKIKRIQIVACGTSYHAGLIGKYWLEEIAGIPCQVEIASEHRYRIGVVEPDTLFVTLSQSGETADTLAAARQAKKLGYLATLAICNQPESALSRESDFVLLTHAGLEIGVASTKSFTAQLVALFLLTIELGRYHKINNEQAIDLINRLKQLPEKISHVLMIDTMIKELANKIFRVQHLLILGRDIQWPVALETALKLKEIAYIHADAYSAGELKHGPLALVDSKIFVIALAPTNHLLHKLQSNLQEVLARNGNLIVLTDRESEMKNDEKIQIITMPTTDKFLSPIIYAIPMQLLAYYMGVLKNIDVDHPRNLAKSVTVE